MYLIVGLGNPGKQYESTRHNVGFMVADALAEDSGVKLNQARFKSLTGQGMIAGVKAVIMKPQTFMNLSGEAVRAAMDFYKCDPDTELIVISDDIDLAPGRLRIREKGSAGGHNGLKNIILHSGTQGFTRVKLGVGAKPQGGDLANHVLGHFAGEDKKLVDEAVKNAVEAVKLIINGDTAKAMNMYN